MLRIHLSPEDVARLSFKTAPHLEIGASVQALRSPNGRPGVERWRNRTLPRLPRAAWPLLEFVMENGHASRELLEYCGIEEYTDVPDGLVAACRAYEAVCMAPVKDAIRACVDAELVRVGQALLSDGAATALDGLGPGISFDGRTLAIDADYGTDLDVHLGGQGLRLIPALFWNRPGFTDEGVDVPTLVYPVARPKYPYSSSVDDMALEKLLGRNRARVLRAAASGGGTGELARSLGISAASASEHLGVLRDAGFVVTQRDGKAVRHHLTPLGAATLRFG
ncbi:ArsR/SmtB family transcription factor [Stackebrandtia nassauensis]|uniref:Putative transcriptional regulator, ArsR family n=1 Tax=Stackebrandtia nassauensis (strain DSM 44728 / CIP 108903 / NRRL B-16338 / NBRC 102104 / LLR-40K-21) TaxID=446470 RepID=D3Q4H3_STANL|nr:winged helix-turn-helix domain-containing protein [Stackebrandtia nassauensis]ADD40133.1 putative transcriptional regulator, ArsR family [Stackebrandtia nassauensis DSM 44728]